MLFFKGVFFKGEKKPLKLFDLKKFNNRGVSLIEMVVAMGISSVLILALVHLNSLQQKGLSTVISKYERAELLQEIREILSDDLSCEATLGKERFNPNNTAEGSILNIVRVRGEIDTTGVGGNNEGLDPNLSDIIVFTANTNEDSAQSYGNKKIKFLGFGLETSSLVNVPANTTGIVFLVVNAVTPQSTYARNSPQKIRVNIETGSSGNILRCGVEEEIPGLSLRTMCSTLGGYFDPNGRSGRGNCSSLKLTGDLTVNSYLVIYSEASSVGGSLQVPPAVNLLSDFNWDSGEGITANEFCETLGGQFDSTGRGFIGDCQNMTIEGGISIGGTLNTAAISFSEGPMPTFPPTSSSGEATADEICQTLGGVYDPSGRDGNGDCQNIEATGTFIYVR